MKIDIHIFKHGDDVPEYIGYIESDKFDADECFDICNWSAYRDTPPDNLVSDISSSSRGICFTNPETGDKWLAKSFGWVIGKSLEITEYVRENKNKLIWK